MLAWAADAGEAVFSGGFVLAAIALVTVLPEFVIEVRFAFIQATELVTANLTGATRLLLTGAIALPLLVAFSLAGAGPGEPPPLQLAPDSTARARDPADHRDRSPSTIAVRGSLTIFDGVILLALYVLYAQARAGHAR